MGSSIGTLRCHRTHTLLNSPPLLVLLVYDCLLTSNDELDFMWSQTLSISTVIFALNRSAAVVYIVTAILAKFSAVSHTTC